jgi:hypothetical protein
MQGVAAPRRYVSPRSEISRNAEALFSSPSIPSLRFTPGARSNWMSEYATTWKRLPHGSRKSSPRDGSTSSPSRRTAARDGLDVVDDQPEVALAVRLLRAALGEREKLVAGVDERHPSRPAAQLEAEQTAVEIERGVHVADLEGDVVEADEARHRGTVPRRHPRL